ncbi:MAG: MFS transporter [Alphaproteobacteria bacterium]|nr:MFS transporter [Alphaproteobacteria bacterium]
MRGTIAVAEALTSRQAPDRRIALVVAASAAGTTFEWYDFFIFGSLASIIAKHFFAGSGESQGYIFALLTFAAGFAVRPLGAVVFGSAGDRFGRKRTFLVTIALMGFATFAMGLLPDAQTMGPGAAYLLIALRVLQGFAVGGEYGGAAIYVAEHAHRTARGRTTGWIQVSATAGLFLAIAVVLITRVLCGESAFAAWAWRIPFLLSAVLLAISLWIRLRLDESPVFRRMKDEGTISRAPLSEAFGRWKSLRSILVVLFGILMGQGVVWYTAQFYTQFFLERIAKVEPATVNLLILAVAAISAPLHYLFARLSDVLGRKPVMLFGLGLGALFFLPGFQMLTNAVNPALTSAASLQPVFVVAHPGECSFQFDPIGRAKFSTPCDFAKQALANSGIPYRNRAGPPGRAYILVGSHKIAAPSHASTAEISPFAAQLARTLRTAGYPSVADPLRMNLGLALLVLTGFVVAAAALYGPQAAALVELFPARIRYSALSVPYHVGVGWFGGFLPATAFAIVAQTGDIYAGLWYPTIVAGLGFLITLVFLPETRGRDVEA